MKATIYKALSNKGELTKIQAGHSLAQEFEGIDLENTIFIVNGHEVHPDYIIKDEDLITVRVLPGAASTALAVGLFIGAACLIGGVAVGVALYYQQQELNEKLEAMRKMSNAPTIDNRPFLRGASNTVATGNSQPYYIGHNLFTPYLHSAPFYEITGTDGAEQYTTRALELGFNKIHVNKIGMGDQVIKTWTGEDAQQGAFNLDAGLFADGKGEIIQDGSLFSSIPEANYKHVVKLSNTAVPRDIEVEETAGVYFNDLLDSCALDVDIAISFAQGLYAFNDDGDKVETELTVTPEYSTNGGQTWTPFSFNNNGVVTNVFKRNEQKELRYIAHKDFTLADYNELKASGEPQIAVRVRSNAKKDAKLRNDVYVMYIQSKTFDPLKSSIPAGVLNDSGAAGLKPCLIVEDRERKFCSLCALKIKATKNNQDKTDKINIICDSMARTWDGTAWSKEKHPTRNPAAAILEVLTSATHAASRYNDDELDLESLGELYEHCETNSYLYDQVITQNTKKADTIKHILDACGAVLYRDIYGRLAVAIDREQPNALAIFNSQNIVSISNTKDFTRRADGVRVKYICSDNDIYRENTYLIMREENGRPVPITEDSIIREIQLTGITTHSHVVKYARRLMAIEVLRPKATTIEVGNEGVFYTPYSKVLLQDESLKIGLGSGVIQGVSYKLDRLDTITVDGLLNFEPGKKYGIIVQAYTETGAHPLPVKVKGTGRTSTLKVSSSIYATDAIRPEAGCVFSFGELDASGEFVRVATPYIISDIKRTGARFALELVNYNPAIFDAGTIPPYKPNITEPAAPAPALPQYNEVIPGKPGEQGLTIFIEKPALLYNADNSGLVDAGEQSDKITILQGTEEIPFNIGEIVSPPGFEITTLGSRLFIKALPGSAMAKQGIINVPLVYRPIIVSNSYTDDSNLDIYADENGDRYSEIKYSSESYIYNVGISYAKSIKGDKGQSGAPGINGDRGARYWGTAKPAEPVLGDFYLDAKTCLLYEYNAKEAPLGPWAVIPEDDSRYLQAIEDIIDNVDPDDAAQAGVLAKANIYALKLVSKTILASKIFTQQLELTPDETGAPAYLQGNYRKGEQGFRIDSNGNAEFNKAVIRGNVYAENGIFNGEVNATSGTFTGEVIADGFTLRVSPGDVAFGRLEYSYFASAGVVEKKTVVMNSIGDGTIRLKIRYKASSWEDTWRFTLYLRKNNSVIWTRDVANSDLNVDIDVPLLAGDTFDLDMKKTGGEEYRAQGWGFIADLCISKPNEVFKRLCTFETKNV